MKAELGAMHRNIHAEAPQCVWGGMGGARACVRACGNMLHIVMLDALLMYTLCVSFCYIFHLDVHYVCNVMFVQRFEPRGMHFTNLHYYY